MSLSSVSLSLFRFLLPPTLISLLWLYLYPPLHNCAFPQVVVAQGACLRPGSQSPAVEAVSAPFRLLVLADPQLEGDTSLPDPNAPIFPSLLQWKSNARERGLASALQEVVPTLKAAFIDDLFRTIQAYRKRLDLLGNDYYLAHIYRSVKSWTNPTHTVVLGDLIGSQWIDDAEFEERARRFWQRVFTGASPVPPSITGSSSLLHYLGDDRWSDRVITVVGNHDIGYAGDIDEHRIERFTKHFGLVNWDVSFSLANDTSSSVSQDILGRRTRAPELRLVILNSMNLDEPAADPRLRDQTWQFLQSVLEDGTLPSDPKDATILLTHVPLHKEAGVCVDAPLIDLFPAEYGGGIREQNHLTPETSEYMLNHLPSSSIILNGHDHEGCDVLHSQVNATPAIDPSSGQHWKAKRVDPRHTRRSSTPNSIHEITVRSMMGSFGGNAGFLSAWYDSEDEHWQFAYSSCVLGVQHYWWATHVLVLIQLGLLALWAAVSCNAKLRSITAKQKQD